jgi:hypothetical protein
MGAGGRGQPAAPGGRRGIELTVAAPATAGHETAAERRLYLEIGLTPVRCAACGAEVAVKKNSRKHTSVQWTRSAVAACPELAAGDGLRLGCPRLKESIAQAVREGVLVVPDE